MTDPSGQNKPAGYLTGTFIDKDTGCVRYYQDIFDETYYHHDSLSLLKLVLFVQEKFGIGVDDVDLVPEHFDSVDAISAYLRSQAGKTASQPGGHG